MQLLHFSGQDWHSDDFGLRNPVILENNPGNVLPLSSNGSGHERRSMIEVHPHFSEASHFSSILLDRHLEADFSETQIACR